MLRHIAIVALLAVGVAVAQSTAPPNAICAGHPTGYFVRDVRQCNAFFRCSNQGVPVFGVCQTQGSVFSEPLQRCVWANEMKCFMCPAGQPYAQVEVEAACGQFIRCIDTRPQHMECARGLLFDAVRGTCNLPHLVRCGEQATVRCPTTDNPNNRVWWRDPQDCSLYAVCVNGRPVRSTCATGLSFNTQTLRCDFPQNTNCQGGGVGPGTPQFSCAAQEPLPLPIYPHPTDCQRYFICDGPTEFPHTCPNDTLFDTVQQRCDHPDRAVCAPGARTLLMMMDGGLSNATVV